MALLINGYSLVAMGLLVLVIVALLTSQLFSLKWVVAAVALTSVSMVLFQLAASTKASTISSPENFDNALISGKPVLVQLYSNF